MTWVAVTPALSWLAAVPALLVAVAVLWGPGLLVARASGARGLSLLSVAPVLTLGLLGLVVLAESLVLRPLGVGLPPGPVVLGLVLVLALLVAGVVRVVAGWRAVPDRTPASRPRERRVDAVPVALACLLSAASFLRATGGAGVVEQSNDSPFHLAAVAQVAEHGGSWQVVRSTTGGPGYYPPLFHDLSALVLRLTGVLGTDVVAATSVVLLLVVAVVWPLGVDALVRTLLTSGVATPPRWRPDRVGRAVAMTLVVATCAFPAQLVQFGALWPNLLGLALVPGTLAALVDLAFPAGRAGARASLWTPALDVTVLGLGVLALGLAHPGALLSFGVAGAGLVVAAAVTAGRWWWGRGQRVPVVVVGLLTLVVVLAALALVVRGAFTMRAFEAQQPWSVPEALAKVAGLDVVRGTHLALVGPLALAGVVVCLWTRRHRWLVVGWALTAVQVVLAGSVHGKVTSLLTGLWYHETARLSSALAVTMLPLAAIGAVAVVAGVAALSGTVLRRATAVVLAVAAIAWVVVGVGDVFRVERDTYEGMGPDRTIVTPQEAAFYARTLRPGGASREPTVPGSAFAGEASPGVIGDPFGGAMFAALYSGRPTPVTHFGTTMVGPKGSVADLTLTVAKGLSRLDRDPAVCDAVRALRVGYAVENTAPIWTNDGHFKDFSGLRGLDGTPGLRLVGREGTVSVYRLTRCLATPGR